MNEMSKQMEMFDDGGLMDEGGTVDPVSGNDVPPGSNQEEVRDDIPAQLSEGEFVFPADVVRYFGLEKLMEMRQEAKMGLQRMDDMGQMGNSEEAIMPDNLPFDIDDIDMEDDNEPQEFNLGGVVQQPGTGIAGYTPPPTPTTGYTPPPVGVAVAPVVPGSQPQVAFTPATASTNIPTFGQFVGTSGGRYDELVTYVNDAGVVRQIPHVNGKPIYPVPEGFKKQEKPTDAAPESPLVDTTTTTQQSQGDGSDNQNYGGGTSLTTGEKIAGYSPEEIKSGVASAKDRYAVTGNRGIDLLNFLPGGQFLKGLLGTDDKPSTGLFSNTPEAMPTGFTDSDGNMIPSASADYMKNLGGLESVNTPGVTEDTVQSSRTSGSPLPSLNGLLPASAPTVRNLQNLRGMLGVSPTRYVGFNKGDLDPNSGGFFNKDGVAIDPKTGGAAKNESGTMNYASFEDYKNAIAAGTKSGWRGGVISSKQYSGLSAKGKANYNKYADLTKNRKGGGISVKETAKENKAKADKARADEIAADNFAKSSKAKADKAKAAMPTVNPYSPAFGIGEAYDDGGYDDSGLSDGPDDASTSTADSTEDGMQSGDYKGAFVGDTYKKNKLAKQMKRSGLTSKK